MKLDRPLCFFDLEATGTDVAADRIVDICVLRREVDGTETVFSSLVNPGVPIPPAATAVHKITDEMVKDEPRLSDLAPKILELFKDADLSGFNVVKYDIPLLRTELERCGVEWPGPGRRVFDSFVIFSRKERRDLTAAYKFFCGKDLSGAHRAEADVRASAEVLDKQLERYADLPQEPAALDAWIAGDRVDGEGKFLWKDGEVAFTFGKNRGKTLREVCRSDPGFLSWMISKDFSPEVKKICRDALEGRFPVKK